MKVGIVAAGAGTENLSLSQENGGPWLKILELLKTQLGRPARFAGRPMME